MKFNQKIYLIPAAKYEKLIHETKENTEETQHSESPTHTQLKTENTSVLPGEQIQKSKDKSKVLSANSEEQNFPSVSDNIQKTKQVTDYSQNISGFSNAELEYKHLESVKKTPKLKGVKKVNEQKSQLKFPPPGLPNLKQLSKSTDNNLQLSNSLQTENRKQKQTIKSRKAGSWIKLK